MQYLKLSLTVFTAALCLATLQFEPLIPQAFAAMQKSEQRILVLLVSVRDIDKKCKQLNDAERKTLDALLRYGMKSTAMSNEERQIYESGLERPEEIDCGSDQTAGIVEIFRELPIPSGRK